MKNPKTHPELGMLVRLESTAEPRYFWKACKLDVRAPAPPGQSVPRFHLPADHDIIMVIVGNSEETMIDYDWESNLEHACVEVLVCVDGSVERIICPAVDLKLA